jgi:hypothetical protein
MGRIVLCLNAAILTANFAISLNHTEVANHTLRAGQRLLAVPSAPAVARDPAPLPRSNDPDEEREHHAAYRFMNYLVHIPGADSLEPKQMSAVFAALDRCEAELRDGTDAILGQQADGLTARRRIGELHDHVKRLFDARLRRARIDDPLLRRHMTSILVAAMS